MDLTATQKRDLIERVTQLTKLDVVKKEDRDEIYLVLMAACSRELAEMGEKF